MDEKLALKYGLSPVEATGGGVTHYTNKGDLAGIAVEVVPLFGDCGDPVYVVRCEDCEAVAEVEYYTCLEDHELEDVLQDLLWY